MTGRVLLLSPSRGLDGGIERYVQTLKWTLAAERGRGRRVDLTEPGPRVYARVASLMGRQAVHWARQAFASERCAELTVRKLL